MKEQYPMESEVLRGLSEDRKNVPPKFLYDEAGSRYFEQITALDEYYVSKAENEILKKDAAAMAKLIGPGSLIIEPGSGSSQKVRHLLPFLSMPVGYVPIEISEEILMLATEEISEKFPRLPVFPIMADFTRDFEMPDGVHCWEGRKIIFFPGSTLGNFSPNEALSFLKRMSELGGHDCGLLIGVDTKKDRMILDRAYDDSQGVTAAFNLNLLTRINRELDADFDVSSFTHEAFYNEDMGRVEMHLVSTKDQVVWIRGRNFMFKKGESIHTESSYKYSVNEFCALAVNADLTVREWWQDEHGLFCVYFLERR